MKQIGLKILALSHCSGETVEQFIKADSDVKGFSRITQEKPSSTEALLFIQCFFEVLDYKFSSFVRRK